MSTESKRKVKLTVEARGETTVIEKDAVFIVAIDDSDNSEIASALIGNIKVSSMAEAIVLAMEGHDKEADIGLSETVQKVMTLSSLERLLDSMGDKECDCPKCRAEREAEGE